MDLSRLLLMPRKGMMRFGFLIASKDGAASVSPVGFMFVRDGGRRLLFVAGFLGGSERCVCVRQLLVRGRLLRLLSRLDGFLDVLDGDYFPVRGRRVLVSERGFADGGERDVHKLGRGDAGQQPQSEQQRKGFVHVIMI
jgi:hypothetical protein